MFRLDNLLQNDNLDASTFAIGPVEFCDSTTEGVDEPERERSEVESEGDGILCSSELRLIEFGGSENWTRGEEDVLGTDPSTLIVSMVVLERSTGRWREFLAARVFTLMRALSSSRGIAETVFTA